MDRNRREAPLLMFTVGFLVLYAPIETWYSFPDVWDPFYLVDLVGMVLLAWGAWRSRRGAPWGPAVLAAGYAWTGANFWRAFFDRILEIAGGGELEYGRAELCFTGCVMLGALTGLIWSLALIRTPPAVAVRDGL